jgi:hypothetical protein
LISKLVLAYTESLQKVLISSTMGSHAHHGSWQISSPRQVSTTIFDHLVFVRGEAGSG